MSWPDPATLLPHRSPALLVTEIVSVADDRSTIETRARLLPEAFPGHFPGRPVLPGVAMIELLAQSLGCLAALSGERGQGMLTGVNNARFRRVVELPAELDIVVTVTDRRFGLTLARGRIAVGGRVACTAELQAVLVAEGA